MKPIDLEFWEPDPEDPRHMRYVGQPIAEEVFQELEERLAEKNCLPDEYFLLDRDWGNGRQIPKGADIFVTTDYGASEGIYLDVYFKWHEDGKPVIRSFATGKTLGESGYDMDRMFLISSAITKAFHGDGWHNEEAQGVILSLHNKEKEALLDLLTMQEPSQEIQTLMEKLGGIVEQTQAQTSAMTETVP